MNILNCYILSSLFVSCVLSSWLTTHVLDTANGVPAEGIRIELRYTSKLKKAQQLSFKQFLAYGVTDSNGRISGTWMKDEGNQGVVSDVVGDDGTELAGYYQLKFYVREYFDNLGQESFWPIATIEFEVTQAGVDNAEHFHVPYLLSNYGLTTYRGS
eukprot:CAMPEP_0201568302 /NCGR_PEP_ID=MMETSP0190_2-20130828/9301_1 /ASSEMBLY_ACC=CAM_ASM_000263 /TAXON_ID=37353 /ORGANISM="Rosalina sp." /LENGTH=156 /DNA_ID=CAMNT_0047989253 /DNA_START=113 /DNA_END=583 /DNA_ORIENTATION=-